MPSPVPSKSLNISSQQLSNRYREAVSQGVRAKVNQLIQAGVLRPARPNKQCSGSWKPRMDIIDDPSSPKIIAIFELPGVKNDNITLQIKDKRLMVLGKRLDPFTEALAAARSTSDQASSTTNSLGNVTNLTPNAPTTPARGAASGFITPTMGKSIRELRYGSFFRSLPVPEGIKQSEVSAGIQDGMLTVSWPRVPAVTQSSVTSEMTQVMNATSTPMNTADSTTTTQASVSAEAPSMLQ